MKLLCSACGASIPRQGKFCSACGARYTPQPSTIICPYCEIVLPADTKFCRNCGKRIALASGTTAYPAAESALPEAKGTQAEPQRSGKTMLYAIAIAALVLVAGIVVFFFQTATPEIPPAVPPVAETVQQTNSPEEQAGNEPPDQITPQAGETATEPEPAAPKATTPRKATSGASRKQTVTLTCNGLGGMPSLLCRAEGPARFWKCAPDGSNWNNDIPDCKRNTKTRETPY